MEGLQIFNDDMTLQLDVTSRIGIFVATLSTGGNTSGSTVIGELAGRNSFFFPVNLGSDRNAYGGPVVTIDKATGTVRWQFSTSQGSGSVVVPNASDRNYNIFVGVY